jgi:predicted amidohydrolase
MRVTAVQMMIRDGDPELNLAHALELLNDAPVADVYMLPELFSTGYAYASWEKAADDSTPKIISRLQRFAAERDAMLIAGTIARNHESKLVNRLWQIRAAETRHYDKAHLIAAFREPELLARGTEACVAEIRGVKSHLSICFDLRYPEMYRAAALDGAEVMLIISEWPAKRAEAFVTLARARAMENQAYVVLCNRIGTALDGTEFNGGSQIIDPEGKTIAEAPSAEGYCHGVLDATVVRNMREQFPVLQWSRRNW